MLFQRNSLSRSDSNGVISTITSELRTLRRAEGRGKAGRITYNQRKISHRVLTAPRKAERRTLNAACRVERIILGTTPPDPFPSVPVPLILREKFWPKIFPDRIALATLMVPNVQNWNQRAFTKAEHRLKISFAGPESDRPTVLEEALHYNERIVKLTRKYYDPDRETNDAA